MKIKSILLVSTALLSVSMSQLSHATTENQDHTSSTTEVMTNESAEQMTKEALALTLDLRPTFNVKSIVGTVGAKGTIKVIPIENVTDHSGQFVATVKDPTIISIDPEGNWQALKAGTTTITLDYTYSSAAIKGIQEAYPDHELLKNEMPQEISIEVKADKEEEKKFMDITPEFEYADMTSLMINDTGSIKVKALEGIETTGTFMPVAGNDSIISLDKTGKWTALKAGSTFLPLMFEYSAETMAALAAKYPNTEFASKEILATAKVIIFDGLIDFQLKFLPREITAKVGQTGKITLEPIAGVSDLTAIFEMVDAKGLIEIDKEGNWKALKAGETSLNLVATLTDESLQRIKKANPHKLEKTPAIGQLLKVTITAETTNSTPTPKTSVKKELPKTGEAATISYSLAGGSLLLLSLVIFKRKKD